jgi:hypothetical protein
MLVDEMGAYGRLIFNWGRGGETEVKCDKVD